MLEIRFLECAEILFKYRAYNPIPDALPISISIIFPVIISFVIVSH